MSSLALALMRSCTIMLACTPKIHREILNVNLSLRVGSQRACFLHSKCNSKFILNYFYFFVQLLCYLGGLQHYMSFSALALLVFVVCTIKGKTSCVVVLWFRDQGVGVNLPAVLLLSSAASSIKVNVLLLWLRCDLLKFSEVVNL